MYVLRKKNQPTVKIRFSSFVLIMCENFNELEPFVENLLPKTNNEKNENINL